MLFSVYFEPLLRMFVAKKLFFWLLSVVISVKCQRGILETVVSVAALANNASVAQPGTASVSNEFLD